MKIKWIKVDLSLFEGAAGEGGGEGGATTGETGNSLVAAKKSGEYDNVKFGKQEEVVEEEGDADPETEETEEETEVLSEEDRRKAYRDLINSDDYKEFYTEDTQKMINRRFKEMKNLQKQVDDFRPILDILSQRYNSKDAKGILEGLENDDSYWQEQAYEKGMSVEQYKEVAKLQRENEALKEAQRIQQENAQINQLMESWKEQEDEMKEDYPEFDLEMEAQNPEFARMLQSGVPVRHAFEVLHMDEIKNSLMTYTAQQTQKAVTDNIKAKGSRPLENGTSAQGAFTVKSDVHKLTKKDREEIIRRVARGDYISF